MTDARTAQTPTGRQLNAQQNDTWQDRHGVHAYKTVPMAEQVAQAIYRDHVEALEMNANGDAGRAAFLGTAAPAATPAETARALRHLASMTVTGRSEIRGTDTDAYLFANVTDMPEDRRALLAVIRPTAPRLVEDPENGVITREWIGTLLTMTIVVSERTPAGRQFCRKGQHPCTPAVTLTFDGGSRRLHWCGDHADDAERYRSDSDQGAEITEREAPMTDAELTAWFTYRGAPAAHIPTFLAENRGKTRAQMDDMYDQICGPMA